MMQPKLDVKTLVIGIVLGIILTAAIGAGVGSADASRFGIALPFKGSALVQTNDGSFYIVNSENGMATRVLTARLNADPDDSRTSRAAPFNLRGPARPRSRTTD